jgi:hypothetical protein
MDMSILGYGVAAINEYIMGVIAVAVVVVVSECDDVRATAAIHRAPPATSLF